MRRMDKSSIKFIILMKAIGEAKAQFRNCPKHRAHQEKKQRGGY